VLSVRRQLKGEREEASPEGKEKEEQPCPGCRAKNNPDQPPNQLSIPHSLTLSHPPDNSPLTTPPTPHHPFDGYQHLLPCDSFNLTLSPVIRLSRNSRHHRPSKAVNIPLTQRNQPPPINTASSTDRDRDKPLCSASSSDGVRV
jgi:hypothetical protein